jgi:peptidylprolyl isomerase
VFKKYLIGLLVLATAFAMIPLAGCAGEKTAQDGDIVKVHYTGTLEDGTQFDSSAGSDPLEFTVGAGQMIPGFEDAVRGMKVGETKTVTIPADEAYGQWDPQLVIEVEKSQFPEDINPEIGDELYVTLQNGNIAKIKVVDLSETTVTIDANPELAGKDLTFKIELVELTRN